MASIAAARDAYHTTDLARAPARYHDDRTPAFYGWNDIWLDPAFRGWSIEDEVAAIRCPVLAVQGGRRIRQSMARDDAVVRRVPYAQRLRSRGIRRTGDQPAALTAAVVGFIWLRSRRARRMGACPA